MAKKSPVVLVTGASSGIGLALTKLLTSSEYRVIATARAASFSRLQGLVSESERVHLRELDVTSEAQRVALIQELDGCFGGVDVLVNNAGISFRSVIEHMSHEEARFQMEANFHAPMALARLVLPKMREKRSGKIINVSSVGGMMAMPTMGAYSASKFALEGASEALWYELRPFQIAVSLVQPGFIHSNSFKRVVLSEKARSSLAERDAYALYYERMGDFIEHIMNMAFATPESIAQKIVKTMRAKKPPLRVTATADAFFFTQLRRFLPRKLYHAAVS